MQLTRRNFAQWLSMMGLSVATGITTMGLSCGNVFSSILNYVPIALEAVTTVVGLLTGNGIVLTPLVQVALTDLKAAIADVTVVVNEYNASPTADKSSLALKIADVLQIVDNNITTFWNSLNIPNGVIATLVEGILGVITSTLQAFLPQLSQTSGIAKLKAARMITAPPVKRSAKQMKSDINALLTKAGYPAMPY